MTQHSRNSKVTIANIIINYLQTKMNSIVFSYQMEKELPFYGLNFFKKMHTPSTYSRAWRQLRQSKKLPFKIQHMTKLSSNKNIVAWGIYPLTP